MKYRELLIGKTVILKLDGIETKGTIVNVRYKKQEELWIDVPGREHLTIITSDDVIRYEVSQ